MEQKAEYIAKYLKRQLVGENKNSGRQALVFIKHRLETTNDYMLVQAILEADILDFLLEELQSLNYLIIE